MAKNSRKHRKALRATAQKRYHRLAAAMAPDYVPPPLVKDPLQNDPDFRAEIRQRGGIVEKRDGRFVVVSLPKQPNDES